MNIAVWDTYVKKEDGSYMHFDILVPDTVTDRQQIVDFGNQYLATKELSRTISATDQCRFCHVELPSPQVLGQLTERGFAVIEMENCN